ncbi:NADPH-dependent F420 reductase [Amycolatopsis thermoflava]|uniref:NADPH-dependent F420 reductase n=1 Tax=Amycolatopsis thermoflava TaxID=84480 RepID=UPI0036597013
MRISVLGSGIVGRTLAARLVELRHRVVIGSRDPGQPHISRWVRAAGELARAGTYAEAARSASIVVNATAGTATVDALRAAGEAELAGKVLVDVANPVSDPAADPPLLRTDERSLGEEIQALFPQTRVVKALNTVSPSVMVNPKRVPGGHVAFLAGDSRQAKTMVTGLLREFGWPADAIVDLGDITGARSMEMLFPLRQRLSRSLGHTNFNLGVLHA